MTSCTSQLLSRQFYSDYFNEPRAWRFCRSLCRCQLTPTLITSVLGGAGGKSWLFGPCELSNTGISASPLWFPASNGRSGFLFWIQGLRHEQGFKSLQNPSPRSQGLVICSALSGSVSVFILWFDSTSVATFTCSSSEVRKTLGISSVQVMSHAY